MAKKLRNIEPTWSDLFLKKKRRGVYDLDGNSSYSSINVNNEITNWEKILFKLPSGGASKSFISDLRVWLNHFNTGTNFQGITIKAFIILPSLLLQKPSKTSKAKDHLKKLDERLAMWRKGKIDELLRECKMIQQKLITSKVRSNDDTARIFAKFMFQGKINASVKFLSSENIQGVLKLGDGFIKNIKIKHPELDVMKEDSLLYGSK